MENRTWTERIEALFVPVHGLFCLSPVSAFFPHFIKRAVAQSKACPPKYYADYHINQSYKRK